MLGLVAGDRLLQTLQLGLQFCGFVDRGLRRHKGARAMVGILECAVEPQRELPAQLECGQGPCMVAC